MLKFNSINDSVVISAELHKRIEKIIFLISMADYIDDSVGNDDGSGYIQYSGNEDQDIPLIKDVSNKVYTCNWLSEWTR